MQLKQPEAKSNLFTVYNNLLASHKSACFPFLIYYFNSEGQQCLFMDRDLSHLQVVRLASRENG